MLHGQRRALSGMNEPRVAPRDLEGQSCVVVPVGERRETDVARFRQSSGGVEQVGQGKPLE